MCARSIHNSRVKINGHKEEEEIERKKSVHTEWNWTLKEWRQQQQRCEQKRYTQSERRMKKLGPMNIKLCILSYNSPIKRDQTEPYSLNHFQCERQSNILTFNFRSRFVSFGFSVVCLYFGTFSFDSFLFSVHFEHLNWFFAFIAFSFY